MKNRAKELAATHWSYLEALMRMHEKPELFIKKIGFHYTTSFIHGYGHGMEDANNERNKLPC